jgi:predicted MarR family transcription regulator
MAPLEVLILHLVNHRDRAKTLADIRLVLHIEDAHLVSYAVRKLSERGLVTTARKGKEKTVAITPEGTALCDRYGEVREALLVELAQETGFSPEEMSRLAALLRAISGSYDHAARAATTL